MCASKILKPLLIISEIFCLIPFYFESNNCCKRFRKSIFYYIRMVLIVSVLLITILYKQISTTAYGSTAAIGNAVKFVHFNGHLIVAICSIVLTNFYNMEFVNFMNVLLDLEGKLSKLGFKIEYNKLSPLSFIIILIVIIQIVIIEIPYFVEAYYNHILNILIFFIFCLPLLLIQIMSLQWIFYMLLLNLYLKALNKIVKTIKFQQCWIIDDLVKNSVDPPNKTIKTCGFIYSKLCSNSKAINSVFSVQFLLLLPVFFIEIVLKSFYICQAIKKDSSIDLVLIISDVIHFIIVLELVIPCFIVKQKSKKFIDNLTMLNLENSDEKFEELVNK